MNSIKDIAVHVEGLGLSGDDSTQGRAILIQLEELLVQLLKTGEGGSIDLGSLPISPDDYNYLVEELGEGEVTADIESMGLTHVRETGVAGVWWITHLNTDDEVMAEFLEVAFCPDILLAPEDDVKESLDSLKARLFESR